MAWTQEDLNRHNARRGKVAVAKPAAAGESKYHNVKVVVDGYTFDSKREAQTYAELKLRQRAGEITELERQVPYDLAVNGISIGKYLADFRFTDVATGEPVVIDVKGARGLPLYQWKKKHLKAQYGITITEIR